ncbi:MAG: hypothetical protein NZ931_02150 [Aigarchaeota archaeon]|nr:hypothetical protein [Aigarchaeota archaeon]
MLVESPSLIAIDEIREGAAPLVFAVSEFGLPGSGATDVLAFSPRGDIAIIECKLAANPEVKRKVIGQIFEYAAYLWGMSYEEFDSRIQRLKEKSLADLVAESVEGEWDEEQFREGVRETLETGSFILVIVVDEINEELRRIIRYLNECSKSAFSLHALEMKRFQVDQLEILVPYLYGVSTKPSTSQGRGQWTEGQFFQALEEENEPNIVTLVRDIYQWSLETADRIWFGTGREVGSFTFHYLKDGKTISVFTIYTNGKLTLNYGWLKNQIPEKTLREFHQKIHEISTLQHIPADFSKWPSIKVEALIETQNLEKFKNAVQWLKMQIKLQM